VIDGIGKRLAYCGCVSLLDFDNTKQIFNSSIMGPRTGGFIDQSARFLEITALNFSLNGKNGLLVRRWIGMNLTGTVAGHQRRGDEDASQPDSQVPNTAPAPRPRNQSVTPLL
jgi:hypothetical protein